MRGRMRLLCATGILCSYHSCDAFISNPSRPINLENYREAIEVTELVISIIEDTINQAGQIRKAAIANEKARTPFLFAILTPRSIYQTCIKQYKLQSPDSSIKSHILPKHYRILIINALNSAIAEKCITTPLTATLVTFLDPPPLTKQFRCPNNSYIEALLNTISNSLFERPTFKGISSLSKTLNKLLNLYLMDTANYFHKLMFSQSFSHQSCKHLYYYLDIQTHLLSDVVRSNFELSFLRRFEIMEDVNKIFKKYKSDELEQCNRYLTIEGYPTFLPNNESTSISFHPHERITLFSFYEKSINSAKDILFHSIESRIPELSKISQQQLSWPLINHTTDLLRHIALHILSSHLLLSGGELTAPQTSSMDSIISRMGDAINTSFQSQQYLDIVDLLTSRVNNQKEGSMISMFLEEFSVLDSISLMLESTEQMFEVVIPMFNYMDTKLSALYKYSPSANGYKYNIFTNEYEKSEEFEKESDLKGFLNSDAMKKEEPQKCSDTIVKRIEDDNGMQEESSLYNNIVKEEVNSPSIFHQPSFLKEPLRKDTASSHDIPSENESNKLLSSNIFIAHPQSSTLFTSIKETRLGCDQITSKKQKATFEGEACKDDKNLTLLQKKMRRNMIFKNHESNPEFEMKNIECQEKLYLKLKEQVGNFGDYSPSVDSFNSEEIQESLITYEKEMNLEETRNNEILEEREDSNAVTHSFLSAESKSSRVKQEELADEAVTTIEGKKFIASVSELQDFMPQINTKKPSLLLNNNVDTVPKIEDSQEILTMSWSAYLNTIFNTASLVDPSTNSPPQNSINMRNIEENSLEHLSNEQNVEQLMQGSRNMFETLLSAFASISSQEVFKQAEQFHLLVLTVEDKVVALKRAFVNLKEAYLLFINSIDATPNAHLHALYHSLYQFSKAWESLSPSFNNLFYHQANVVQALHSSTNPPRTILIPPQLNSFYPSMSPILPTEPMKISAGYKWLEKYYEEPSPQGTRVNETTYHLYREILAEATTPQSIDHLVYLLETKHWLQQTKDIFSYMFSTKEVVAINDQAIRRIYYSARSSPNLVSTTPSANKIFSRINHSAILLEELKKYTPMPLIQQAYFNLKYECTSIINNNRFSDYHEQLKQHHQYVEMNNLLLYSVRSYVAGILQFNKATVLIEDTLAEKYLERSKVIANLVDRADKAARFLRLLRSLFDSSSRDFAETEKKLFQLVKEGRVTDQVAKELIPLIDQYKPVLAELSKQTTDLAENIGSDIRGLKTALKRNKYEDLIVVIKYERLRELLEALHEHSKILFYSIDMDTLHYVAKQHHDYVSIYEKYKEAIRSRMSTIKSIIPPDSTSAEVQFDVLGHTKGTNIQLLNSFPMSSITPYAVNNLHNVICTYLRNKDDKLRVMSSSSLNYCKPLTLKEDAINELAGLSRHFNFTSSGKPAYVENIVDFEKNSERMSKKKGDECHRYYLENFNKYYAKTLNHQNGSVTHSASIQLKEKKTIKKKDNNTQINIKRSALNDDEKDSEGVDAIEKQYRTEKLLVMEARADTQEDIYRVQSSKN